MEFMWTTFYVSDLEDSLYFYNQLLGLPISARFGDEHHQIVMLGEEDAPKVELIYDVKQEVKKVGVGVSIGFAYDNVEVLIGTLQKEGYHIVGPITPGEGMRFFFVSDPDGYQIQLIG